MADIEPINPLPESQPVPIATPANPTPTGNWSPSTPQPTTPPPSTPLPPTPAPAVSAANPPEATPPAPAEPAPEPISSGLSLRALQYSKTQPQISAAPIPTETEAIPEPIFESSRSEPGWLILIKAVGVFAGTFILVFGILEGQALAARVSYYFTHLGTSQAPTELAFLPKLQDRAVTITDIKNRPQEYLDQSAQLAGYSLADLSDNQLLIPKISVNAPIIWGSAPDDATMLANLRQGVVHYGFTALPSDGKGKVFISGHSSSPLWDPGKYKTVFANLDRVEIGDQLALTYQGVVYLYAVTNKQVVKPTDTSVLDQTDEPTLALMTCVPVGTSLNRLIVTSELISTASSRPIPLAPQELTTPEAIFHYLPF